MELICLGDIALAERPAVEIPWERPSGFASTHDTQIMFNWEFPIADRLYDVPRRKGLRFLAYPGAVNVLQRWAPGIATLATNHILDGGADGIAKSMRMLHEAGLQTVGAGASQEEIERPLLWRTTEGELAIVNWIFPETDPDWMTIPGPNCWPGFEAAASLIGELRRHANWIAVIAHWSDELFAFPRPADREIARELAAMGADIVISHHPHVVRGMETIRSCPVFYSLGNYYFADKKDRSGEWILKEAPRNKEALGVRLTFRHEQQLEWELISYWNSGMQTIPDLSRRAEQRVRLSSVPLEKYGLDAYSAWYQSERRRFVQWDSRWHFGLRRRGVLGSLKRMCVRLREALSPEK